MANFDAAIFAATAAAEDLAVHLLEAAVNRCPTEELEDCEDWHGVFNLIDDAAERMYGEGLHQRICRLLTEAGIDLPIDPQVHWMCEDHIVVDAVIAACDVLAKRRLDQMPASFEEALRLATARVHYQRERLGPPLGAGRTSAESEEAVNDWLRGIFYSLFNLDLLKGLGMVVVRDGRPVLPSTVEERSEAYHALQHYLLSDVRQRLVCYCDPHDGYIEVRDVALTVEEEAAVRALAKQIVPAAA